MLHAMPMPMPAQACAFVVYGQAGFQSRETEILRLFDAASSGGSPVSLQAVLIIDGITLNWIFG